MSEKEKNPQDFSSKRCSEDVKRRWNNPAAYFPARVQKLLVNKPKRSKREKVHEINSSKRSENLKFQKTWRSKSEKNIKPK